MHREKWPHCLPLQLPKMPRLEGTSKDNLVYSSMGKGTQMRLSDPLSNHILKTSSHGDSTMSLGSLFQFMIVLAVNNFFLILTWNLSPWNLYPLLFVFSMWALVKRNTLSSFLLPLSAGILWQDVPWALLQGQKNHLQDLQPPSARLLPSPSSWSVLGSLVMFFKTLHLPLLRFILFSLTRSPSAVQSCL